MCGLTVADLGTFQIKTATVDTASWRTEVDLEGGLSPPLKDFPATLLACGETEVNHDASKFSLRIIRQSFESGVFRIKLERCCYKA